MYFLRQHLLALVALLFIPFPLMAHGFEVVNSDGVTIYYNKISDTECEVTKWGNLEDYSATYQYSGDIIIPSSVSYNGRTLSITAIGEHAFGSCRSLTSIEIPEGVTSIGNYAFDGCSSLTSIVIPEGVTSIGYYAFRGCTSLTSIEIPSSVTSIGNVAFRGCSSLTSIEIPASVTSIGNEAFWDCSSLTSIVVDRNNFVYDSRNNCNAIIKTSTNELIVGCCTTIIPSSVTSIGDHAFYYCSSLTSIEIPEGVTSIGNYAFDGCSSLTSIVIPEGVTSIGSYAFYYCSSLTSMYVTENIPICDDEWTFHGIEHICTLIVPYGYKSAYRNALGWRKFTDIVEAGEHTITYTTNDGQVITLDPNEFNANVISNVYQNGVGTITFDREVTKFNFGAFANCHTLTSIEIPEGVTSFGFMAFYGCRSLTSIEIPSSVTSIDDEAFSFCTSLTSIVIPASVTSIGNGLDGCTSLTSIIVDSDNRFYDSRDNCNAIIETSTNTLISGCNTTIIPSSVTNIGTAAFSCCSDLTSIVIPVGVTNIGSHAFFKCSSLTSIEIPKKVSSIGNYAFYNCSSLTSIEIPESVTSIGDYAFDECSSLTSIIVDSDNRFYDSRNNCNAIIETSTNTLIRGCNTTIIPSGVTSISDHAFDECSSLTSIVIPSSVTSIGSHAFAYCSSLTSIVIPSSVTDIGDLAFYGTTKVTTLYFSAKIDVKSVTGGMKELEKVILGEGVTSIGDYAFYDCRSLTTIEIPTSVTSIGNKAFYDCRSLTSIVIPSGVTSISDYAFQNCFSLTSVTIPSSVTSIGSGAFGGCSSLTSVTIPSSVTSIGNSAFSGCSLTSIEIPEGVTSIGDYAFEGCSSLTSIVIPEGVTSIGYKAFYGCRSLTTIQIPSSVTSIGENVFDIFWRDGELTLSSIYVGDTPSTIASSTFNGVDKNNCILYVPAGCTEAYRNAPYWSEFTNIVEINASTDISQYEDVLYVENAEAATGRTATLSIQLNNVKELTGFQGDIVLPDGCSFVFDEYGYAEAKLTEVRTNSKIMSFDTQVQEDGSLRLLAYSSKSIAFTGNEGEVATVTIEVDSELEDGEYLIQLKNIVLTEASGKTIEIDKVVTTLTVFSYMLGDANGDRKINVGDLAATASHILGTTPENFVAKAADANEDTKINVGDLAKIAGIILGTTNAAPQRAAAIGESCFEANMYVEPVEDNEYLLHVGINNDGVNFSGFQFDLQLPEGLNVGVDAYGYAEAELSTSRTTARRTDIFDSAFMEDGSLRVLCASTSNALFEGESGEVATIRLVADESFVGEGVLSLTQIFYTATGEGLEAADVVMDFQNAISSIRSISMNVASKVYDMNGVVVGTTADIESLPKGIYVVSGKKVVK